MRFFGVHTSFLAMFELWSAPADLEICHPGHSHPFSLSLRPLRSLGPRGQHTLKSRSFSATSCVKLRPNLGWPRYDQDLTHTYAATRCGGHLKSESHFGIIPRIPTPRVANDQAHQNELGPKTSTRAIISSSRLCFDLSCVKTTEKRPAARMGGATCAAALTILHIILNIDSYFYPFLVWIYLGVVAGVHLRVSFGKVSTLWDLWVSCISETTWRQSWWSFYCSWVGCRAVPTELEGLRGTKLGKTSNA